MRQRLARLEERGSKKRQMALDAMCDVGLKKLEHPDFTASARSGMSLLLVLADNLIPALLGAATTQTRSPNPVG
jgi:hypothetical protein